MRRGFTFSAIVLRLCSGVWRGARALPGIARAEGGAAVSVTDNGNNWTLDNGIVKATINKGNGNMTSLVYHGVNTMGQGGYWEQTPQGSGQLSNR